MSLATVILNPGSGGAAPLVDSLTTADGGAAPSSAVVQAVKVGFGNASDFKSVTPTQPLPVGLTNFISTVNSSTAALGIGAVFTGTAEDVTAYSTITVTVFADQASAADGLQIQQSSNAANWDFLDVYTIPASTGKTFKADVSSKFYRVVYTNGGTANTVFRLQTVLNQTGHMGSSIRPGDGRSIQNDVREVAAYIAGYNGTSLDLLRSTIANGLQVDVTRSAANADLGLQADAVATTDTGTFSLVGLVKRLLTKTPLLGATTSTLSQPVTVASDTASGTITTQNLVPAGAATAGSAVEITLNGAPTIAIQTTGTYTGALTLQATVDGAAWVTVGGSPFINVNTAGALATITSALQSVFQAEVGGFVKARITGLAAMTGTATVSLRTSPAASLVALDAALPTGANVVGAVTQSGTWTVQPGNTANTTPWLATVTGTATTTPATTTTTAATLSSAATTNATSVKATAGTIYSISASNVGAGAAFLKIFNLATAPTVGTSVPFLTIPIAASGVVNLTFGAQGFRMATGIAFCITNLVADADTTVIAAAQVKVAIGYI
jgi:uncharacterized protein YwbE